MGKEEADIAADALREADAEVKGMVAIFTYQTYITEEDILSLKEWRKDQQAWSDRWN